MVAGRSAGPLFHKKVTVEGADEDLSFNILIPLPPKQPPQGISSISTCMCALIFFSVVAPSTTAQQQPQQGIYYMSGIHFTLIAQVCKCELHLN